MKIGKLSISCALTLAGLLPVWRPTSAAAQQQQVQVIELNAKKYEYSLSPVHVKAGTKVQLKITALDHDHGFKMSPSLFEKQGTCSTKHALLRRLAIEQGWNVSFVPGIMR